MARWISPMGGRPLPDHQSSMADLVSDLVGDALMLGSKLCMIRARSMVTLGGTRKEEPFATALRDSCRLIDGTMAAAVTVSRGPCSDDIGVGKSQPDTGHGYP